MYSPLKVTHIILQGFANSCRQFWVYFFSGTLETASDDGCLMLLGEYDQYKGFGRVNKSSYEANSEKLLALL